MIAIITDIHFDCRGGSSYFLKRYELFFDNIFFPYLIKHNIKTLLILGDTWENRKFVNTQSLKEARAMFFDRLKELDVKVISILGNHDVTYRNTNDTNSMDIIESAYDNVYIVKEYEEMKFGNTTFGLMSWVNRENLERNLDRLKTSNVDVMCGHWEIANCEMTSGNFCENGLEQSLFSKFELVLSGHFHIMGTYGNIKYLGNPFQTNWDDFGMKRGFHVMDTSNRKLSFIENTFHNYDAFEYDDSVDLTTFDFLSYKDKYIKIITPKVSTLNQIKYMEFINKLTEHSIDYTLVENVDDNSITDKPKQVKLLSNNEMIIEYIDKLHIEESNEVKGIMLDLYKEVISNMDVE